MTNGRVIVGMASALIMTAAAQAGPLPIYPKVVPTGACATFGNFVSCSAAVANTIDGLARNESTPAGYAVPLAQGALKDYIVLGSGGNTPNNTVINPVPTTVEDQYKTNQNLAGGNGFFYTGAQVQGGGGGANDPSGGTLNTAPQGDTDHSWDVSLAWLAQALTIDGVRRQMTILFDFNQPGNDTLQSLPIWALLTIRDVDGGQADVSFGIQPIDPLNVRQPVTNYNVDENGYLKFNAGNGLYTTPKSTDFMFAVGVICVNPATQDSFPKGAADCPSGYQTVETNLGTNLAEFINYVPQVDGELGRLEDWIGKGYDVISAQVWMGCFGTQGAGPALADQIPVAPCETGGFSDIAIAAGAPLQQQVPEPGVLSLLALAMLGAGVLGRRRRHAS